MGKRGTDQDYQSIRSSNLLPAQNDGDLMFEFFMCVSVDFGVTDEIMVRVFVAKESA